MIRLAVEGCHRTDIDSGLCGRVPSDHPGLAEFLVELGIDSISFNPDGVIRTTRLEVVAERRLGRSAEADGP
jgi:pyruvate,water dikinase